MSPATSTGLRMRFPNSPQFLMNAEALGADATEVAYEELFLALQQGTVDGQENPIVNIAAISLDEVQDYISLSSHQANSNLVIIGEVWGELSAEQQDALQAAVDAAVEQVPGCVDEDEQKTLAEWEESGALEIVDDVDVEAFRTQVDSYLRENFNEEQLAIYEGDPRNRRVTGAGEVQTLPGTGRCRRPGDDAHPRARLRGSPGAGPELPPPRVGRGRRLVDAAVDGLERLWELGIRTVVDLTVLGLGRDVARVAQGGRADPGQPGGVDRVLHRRRAAGVLPHPRAGPARRRPGPAGGVLPPRHRASAWPAPACGPGCSRSSPTGRGSPPTCAG